MENTAALQVPCYEAPSFWVGESALAQPTLRSSRAIFCNNFNRIIADSKASAKEVALYVGVTEGTISRWRSHKSELEPNFGHLDKIAAFFKTRVSALFEVEPTPAVTAEMLEEIHAAIGRALEELRRVAASD